MARPSPQSALVTDPDPPRHRTDNGTSHGRQQGDSPITEDLLVRNYDVERRYTLYLRAETPGSGTAFEWTYHLDPGEFRSEIGILDPGTYEVTVETECCGRASETCTVGPGPDGAVLVETGNSTVAVSNEIY